VSFDYKTSKLTWEVFYDENEQAFAYVQAVSSKSVHGCFVENVEVYGVFDSFSEAYEYAHKNKLGVTGEDFMIRNILDKDYWEV
jgi:hypothetical protein